MKSGFRFVFFIVWFLFVTVVSKSAEPVNNVELKSSDDLAIARRLDNSLQNVTNLISKCVKEGKPNTTCLCENKQAVELLSQDIDNTLKERPGWKDKTLNMPNPNKKTNIILNMPGLIKQSEVPACE